MGSLMSSCNKLCQHRELFQLYRGGAAAGRLIFSVGGANAGWGQGDDKVQLNPG